MTTNDDADRRFAQSVTFVDVPDTSGLPFHFAEIAEVISAEIRDDVQAGRVPTTISSFGELDDYVDANIYGGLCDDASNADVSNEDCARIQAVVDVWLQAEPFARPKINDRLVIDTGIPCPKCAESGKTVNGHTPTLRRMANDLLRVDELDFPFCIGVHGYIGPEVRR